MPFWIGTLLSWVPDPQATLNKFSKFIKPRNKFIWRFYRKGFSKFAKMGSKYVVVYVSTYKKWKYPLELVQACPKSRCTSYLHGIPVTLLIPFSAAYMFGRVDVPKIKRRGGTH